MEPVRHQRRVFAHEAKFRLNFVTRTADVSEAYRSIRPSKKRAVEKGELPDPTKGFQDLEFRQAEEQDRQRKEKP